MDKAGHMYTAYFQGLLGYKGAKWTGLSDNNSILTGIVMGTVFQGTIELMDGFAKEWGFSVPDFTANTLGTVIFAGQQYFWEEQRIRLKFSSHPVDYPNLLLQSTDLTLSSPLSERINKIYGEGQLHRILKDYNGQTYWASINMESFLLNSCTFPKWLNIAIGYSVDNYYGAYENSWTEQDREFILDPSSFPRLQQYYLSLDLDLSRVRTKSAFFNTLLDIFDIFKCPAPAIGIDNRGNLEFHLFYF